MPHVHHFFLFVIFFFTIIWIYFQHLLRFDDLRLLIFFQIKNESLFERIIVNLVGRSIDLNWRIRSINSVCGILDNIKKLFSISTMTIEIFKSKGVFFNGTYFLYFGKLADFFEHLKDSIFIELVTCKD